MDGYTAREGVVNGQITDKGGGVVASLLIHIPIHMKVDRVVAHGLLAHVQQLHPRHVDSPVASLHLEENHRHSLKKKSELKSGLCVDCFNHIKLSHHSL